MLGPPCYSSVRKGIVLHGFHKLTVALFCSMDILMQAHYSIESHPERENENPDSVLYKDKSMGAGIRTRERTALANTVV